MNIKRGKISRAGRSLVALLGLWLFQVSVCTAAGTDSQTAVPEAEENSGAGPIEEIEITGQRLPRLLRQEIRQAEVQMFSVFNDLNSTDDFNVVCGDITHTGTRLPTWECDVGYVKRARIRDAQNFLMFGDPPRSDQQLFQDYQQKTDELNTEMRALALEHPELAEAMLELQAKKQQLEAVEREQRGLRQLFSNILGSEQE